MVGLKINVINYDKLLLLDYSDVLGKLPNKRRANWFVLIC